MTIDLHPQKRDAAVAYLYEPSATLRDVAEDVERPASWVDKSVREYQLAMGEARGSSK